MSVEIIAEVGQAHEGSLGILHSYIDALAQTGVDTIKFQTHIAEAESSIYEPFRVKFSYVDKTRYDYWQRMEFSLTQWQGIKQHCQDVGLKFLSSPFSNKAVDLLEKLDVQRYKIGSGETNNLLMLDKIVKTGKDIIVSTGMSSFSEIDKTLSYLNDFGNQVSIMQCTTKYPTEPEDIGLNVIGELQKRYNLPVGFSDHSGKIFASLAAVSLGADIIEVHSVFDKQMFGPDSKSSLTMSDIKQLVDGVRFIEASLSSKVDKGDNTGFADLKHIFEKTLAINKNKQMGQLIELDDLEAKKPANKGISASDYKMVVGKKLNCNLNQWDFITGDMFDD